MITSDQIHEKEFSFKLRGYNDAEVDAYLDQLAAFIDNLSKENKELRERLKSTTDQLTYMKNLESTLRDTLITAQRSADETTRGAKANAEEIIASANAEAARIVRQANGEADAIRRQLGTLRQQAAVYRQNFKMLPAWDRNARTHSLRRRPVRRARRCRALILRRIAPKRLRSARTCRIIR